MLIDHLDTFFLVCLMRQYSFARWCLLSVVVVCNAAGGRVDGWAADTARRASTVTFHLGNALF